MIPTQDPEYFIRAAEVDDVPLVLEFIKELGEYEKLSDQVQATAELLSESLFGKSPYAEVFLGFYRGEAVAFALFFHNYSTFLGRPGLYLEDLYVREHVRGKGLGKILLSYLAFLARERGCGRLEWWCLDWNKPALGFYRSLGC